MFNVRVIPRLDIKGPNLVKGIHLEGLRVLGKPEQFARYYYENGADELIYFDVVASLYGRNSLLDIIKRTSKEIFIPLTVGGGIRTIEDIQNVLKAGADKVALNTAVIKNPSLLEKVTQKFGSSTIVVSIEAMRKEHGSYEAFTDNGRERTGINVMEWAKRAEDLGAGEIYLMSIDRDGTGLGYDIDLVKSIADTVSIPVIAGGGAGNLNQISDVIERGHADAVSMASILHYKFIETNRIENDYSVEGNIEFLKHIQKFTKVTGSTLPDIKKKLLANGISCRSPEDFSDES
jgi:imidazole glycerol-phosphate synthase subunit HisF